MKKKLQGLFSVFFRKTVTCPKLVLKSLSLLSLLLFLIVNQVSAQEKILELMARNDLTITEIETRAKRHFDSAGTGRGTGYKRFHRWLYERKFHTDENGYFISPQSEWDNYQRGRNNMNAESNRVAVALNWTPLGPSNWTRTSSWNPGTGRLSAFAIHPANENIIYVGSPGGGLWKSINAGATWVPLTDNNPLWMNIFSIAIDPSDQNIIYAATDNISGIIKSTDAGATWSATGAGPLGLPNAFTPQQYMKILIHPTSANIVFAAADNGIWRSVNGGGSWTQVHAVSKEDIEFKPNDVNIMYASGGTAGSSVVRSIDNGVTWTTLGVAQGITNSGRTLLAVSAANANIVYAVQASGGFFGRMYRSADAGLTFVTTVVGGGAGTRYFGYDADGNEGSGQATYDMGLDVSPTNADDVYIAGILCWRSTNGGTSFTALTEWFLPNTTGYNHADVHGLFWVNSTLYSISDGGLYKSTDNGDNWTDLSPGLSIRQFYRMANSQTDPNVITGGAQDNGTVTRNAAGNWVDWLGADGMEGVVSPTNPLNLWGTSQFGDVYKSTNGGTTYTGLSSPFGGNWVTPIAIHPTNETILYGGWVGFYKSVNSGSSWTKLSGTTINQALDDIAVAPSDPNYLYASRGATLYVSIDGGTTWATRTAPAVINDIAVDPATPSKIWIACNSITNRVLVSTDAGVSFTNISGNLPAIVARTVVVDDNTPRGLYVGMNIGVFYKAETDPGWTDISANLPMVAINELEIQKTSGKLRVATYGRSIWEIPLQTQCTLDAGTLSGPSAICKGGSVTLSQTGQVTGANAAYAVTSGLQNIIYTAVTLADVQTFLSGRDPGTYCVYAATYNGANAACIQNGAFVVPGTIQQLIDNCFTGQCYDLSEPLCVTVLSPAIATLSAVPSTVCDGGSTKIYMTFQGGTGPYTITLLTSQAQTTTVTVNSGDFVELAPIGVGPLTVNMTSGTDANGCAINVTNASVTITGIQNPNAVATPSSQNICSGAAITTIALTGSVSGTVFNWTRDNTVAVTGIAASGSGNISGSLTNTTASPVTVTFTITPTANGCTGTPITATVTVGPRLSITCPANITQNNDADQCGAVVTYAATASNNCGAVTISYSPASGSFFPKGTTTVTATATDAAGNTASCTFTVTVVDAQNPTIMCPANITVNNTTDQCGAVVTYTATASDNCPGVSVSYSPASGSFFPVGTTTVTATATDAVGRTASCTFTVTVVDAQNPTITCPANITVNNTPGQCGANVSFVATASDNCPGTTVGYSPASGSLFPIGTTTVTATVTDASGRTAACTFTVKVEDTEAPTLTCPANVTVTITSGCSKKLTPPQPTVIDNCGLSKLTWCLTGATTGDSPSSGINYVTNKTFNAGVTTVTYTAKDIYGNTSECSFTVSVLETVLPNITCPPNKTVGTDYGYCYWSHVNLGTPNVSDNCGVLCVTNNAPDTFQLGTTIVTWTVTDNSGNTRSCNQTIIVLDKQTPSVTCPANIYQDASATCVTTVTAPDPTYYDNCTVAKLTWKMTGATTGTSPATGINFVGTKNYNVGTTTITYTVKDAANNSWSCSFAVTITDRTRPTVTCPANIVLPATAGACNRSIAVPDPVYSDNCNVTKLTWYTSGATNISSPTSGINKIGTKTFNVGVTTVTYTAYDPWGNSKQCTFTITVTDNQPPVVSCPTDRTLCKVSNNTYSIPAMTRTDNCSVASTTYQVTGVTTRSGTGTNASGLFNLGLSTITWTVTDASGNTTTCSTNVNIVPAGTCRLASNEPTDDPKPETKATSKGKLDLIVQDSKLGVTAYPNPTEHYFNVRVTSPSKETVEIRMYDGLGKVVQVKRGAVDQTYRFGDNVVGGMYFIEVRQAGQIATVKVVKL